MKNDFDVNDIINQKFNHLTVIKFNGIKYVWNKSRQVPRYMYYCQCDCGNYIEVERQNLKQLHTKSCGCLKHKSKNQINQYEICDDYVIGYLSDNSTFIIDTDDYNKIKQYYWYKNDQGYIITYNIKKDKQTRLHRFILNVHDTKEPFIDHIDGDKTNNRKSNLRLCTHKQNLRNRSATKNSSTHAKGVTIRKNKNNVVYIATISYTDDNNNRKYIHCGTFKTIEEAQKARYEKEKELFGEFARL